MAPPPHNTIVAAVKALRGDAVQWRQHADTAVAAGTVVESLGLGTFDLSYFGETTGLVEVYGKLQAKMAQLCGEAADNFAGVAAALESAAEGYDQDERAAVHQLHGTW
jgi:hypothetical protein